MVTPLPKRYFFIVATTLLMVANLPFQVFAADLNLAQIVKVGDVLIEELPTDILLPSIESRPEPQTNFAIPKIASPTNDAARNPLVNSVVLNPTTTEEDGQLSLENVASDQKIPEPNIDTQPRSQKIIITDRRFNGGFQLQVKINRPTDKVTGQFIPVENIGIATFHPTEIAAGAKSLTRLTANATQVTLPLSGTPEKAETYSFFTPSENRASESEALTIINGILPESEGRIGQWELYPAFVVNVPANILPGSYIGSVEYTIVK